MELPKNYKFLQGTDVSYQDHCKACLEFLAEKFDHKKTKNIRLSVFSELLGEKDFEALGKWQITDNINEFNFIIGSYTSHYVHTTSYSVSNQYDTHLYCFGHLKTKTDFGHVFIRPETLIDKVSELLKPLEIDFEGQNEFNKRYYVLSSNQEHTLKTFPMTILPIMTKYHGLSIEFVKNQCLFRMPKALDQKESNELCDFGLELSQLLKS